MPSPLIEPRRLAAIGLLGISLGLMVAVLLVRGSAAGSDALAYWEGVRIWLAGGDPLRPPGLRLPYVYATWLLPIFLPWALLPWQVAWVAWRGAMALAFAGSVVWAYRRRPGWTALLVALLAVPLAVTFDTGNITLFLALGVWAAQFSRPRLGGALWALATATKLIPVVLWPILPPRARLWGLVAFGVVVLLGLATWPQTIAQYEVAAVASPPAFPRPLRIDHAVLLWAAVPWLWRGDLRQRILGARRWSLFGVTPPTSDGGPGAGVAPRS